MLSLRALYKLLPESFRKWARNHPVLGRVRTHYRKNTKRHDQFYDDAYYELDHGYLLPAQRSAPIVAQDIVSLFAPASVVDVGCGTGEYLNSLRQLGIPGHGIELSDAAIRKCHGIGLDVRKHDLTRPGPLPWEADLVFCCEVAEHLPPEVAEILIDKLANATKKYLFFTAAGPNQPGLNHFNCQPKQYWIEKLEARKFVFDKDTTELLEQKYTDLGAAHWFQENLMIFHRS